jgi:excisionase family DNA binding protein
MSSSGNQKQRKEGLNMTAKLWDVDEAAAALHLKPTTLRAWILKGKVTYLKLGRRVFFREEDLAELIANSVVTAVKK